MPSVGSDWETYEEDREALEEHPDENDSVCPAPI